MLLNYSLAASVMREPCGPWQREELSCRHAHISLSNNKRKKCKANKRYYSQLQQHEEKEENITTNKSKEQLNLSNFVTNKLKARQDK